MARLKTHLRGDSPMDTTLSIKVAGTVVPYVIYMASKNCIILRAGLSIFKKYDGTNSAHFCLQYFALCLYLVLSTWLCCVNF